MINYELLWGRRPAQRKLPPGCARGIAGPPWIKQEDEVLRANYKERGSKYVAWHTGRSLSGVRVRASRLGIEGNKKNVCCRFTDVETGFLRDNYKERGPGWCAMKMGKEKRAIIARAHYLKLKYANPSHWTPDMIKFLEDNWHLGDEYCAKKLGKSVTSVNSKFYVLDPVKRALAYERQKISRVA